MTSNEDDEKKVVNHPQFSEPISGSTIDDEFSVVFFKQGGFSKSEKQPPHSQRALQDRGRALSL